MKQLLGTRRHRVTLEQLQTMLAQQRHEEVLDAWPLLDEFTSQALSAVLTALVVLNRPEDVGLFLSKAAANLAHLRPSLFTCIRGLVDLQCQVPVECLSQALRDVFQQSLAALDHRASLELLVAFANTNDAEYAREMVSHLADTEQTLPCDSSVSVVQGFLSCGNLQAALHHLPAVLEQPGLSTVTKEQMLAQIAAAVEEDCSLQPGRPSASAFLDRLEGQGIQCQEAEACVLRGATVSGDHALYLRVRMALTSRGALTLASFEALIRADLAFGNSDGELQELFVRMVECHPDLPDGLFHALLSAATAESRALLESMCFWAKSSGRASLAPAAAKAMSMSTADEDWAADMDDELASPRGSTAAGSGSALEANLSKQGSEASLAVRPETPLQVAPSNADLDAAVADVCTDDAESIFKDMKKHGSADVVSYNIMLKLYMGQKGDSMQRARALLEEMIQSGLRPTTTTYNSIVSGALAHGDVDVAWRTIEEMERNGPPLDAYTVSIILKGSKAQRALAPAEFDRALDLVSRHAVKLDEVLVNVILEACVALRDTRRLQHVLAILKRNGWDLPKRCCNPTYAALIKAYGSAGQTAKACDLWDDITKVQGLEPSEHVYAQMIDVLVMGGNLKHALQLFADMRDVHRARFGSNAFAIAYAMIVRGYAQQKDAVRALKCYEEMKAQGVPVGLVVLNTLVDACCRAGDMTRAAELLQDMATFDLSPDLITYSTLIKGYCVIGDLDHALELFGAMRRRGIKPDAIVFNSLLDGCARKEMPVLCEQVIEDMVSAGVQPSNYSASILIKLYGRISDLDAAFKVLDEMPQKFGFQPNTAVYTTLMSSCTWNGRMDLAMGLLDRMLQAGQLPDEKTYVTLLRGATRFGQSEHIVSLLWQVAEQSQRSRKLLLDTELVQCALHTIMKRRAWSQRGGEDCLQRLRCAGFNVVRPSEAKGCSYNRVRQAGRQGAVASA